MQHGIWLSRGKEYIIFHIYMLPTAVCPAVIDEAFSYISVQIEIG